MTARPRHTIASLRAATITGLIALAGLVAGPLAVPVGAHEGRGIVEVEATHPSGPSVHYIVRVTWEDDGHAATDAIVTAAAVGEDGNALTPVTLAPADDDGRYQGVVDFPGAGDWTVRFTSIDPTGTVEHARRVTAATTTAGDAPPTAADGGGFAPADDGTGEGADEAAAGSGGSGGMPVWLVILAAVVALGGLVTAIALVRRHRSPAGAGTTGAAGPDHEAS